MVGNTTSGVGASLRDKTRVTPKLIDRQKYKALTSSILQLSNTEIQTHLGEQIAVNPSVLTMESISPRKRNLDPDEDELDTINLYDPPDMESEIETGEAERRQGLFLEQAENFIQYAWRRMEEDFDPLNDPDYIRIIKKLLENIDPSYFSTSMIPEDLRPWFEDLLEEFPHKRYFDSKPVAPKADIIFYRNGPKITYAINLGILDHVRLNKISGNSEPMHLSLSGISFPPSLLPSLIQSRRNGLSLLARFLIEKQAPFIQAENLRTALERLRSIKQTELLESLKSEYEIERKKTWASRIIKTKWVKVPFSNELFPLRIFFDEHIGYVNVLKKAIEFHVIQGQNPPLSSPEQLILLMALCNKETAARTIRKTLWPHLQELYSDKKKEWERLGILGKAGRQPAKQIISDSDLTDLVNMISRELKLSNSNFSENDIRKLRKKLNKKRTGTGALLRREHL